MAAAVVSEDELSILVEKLIHAERTAIELAEAGADLARVNEQFALVRSLHRQIGALRTTLARQS